MLEEDRGEGYFHDAVGAKRFRYSRRGMPRDLRKAVRICSSLRYSFEDLKEERQTAERLES